MTLCRSVSQFSDNGLVQFQSAAANQQLLFPAPLSSGFPDDMNVSLLAVFWDDADLTHGDGQLLYQVDGMWGSKVKLQRLHSSSFRRSTTSWVCRMSTPRSCSIVRPTT